MENFNYHKKDNIVQVFMEELVNDNCKYNNIYYHKSLEF